MKRLLFLLFSFFCSLVLLSSEAPLKIVPGDAYIELDPQGGFNLWIKKKV
jgi:hypothetical protein